jgi:hypothetical protein
MTDDGWWDLRKGSTFVYIECGGTHATLHTTDIRMRKGPPVTVDLSLEKNLRSRNTQVGTYIDAQALAAGAIRGLTRLEVSDDHALAGLEHHLKHTQDAAPPWRLILNLRGQHGSR